MGRLYDHIKEFGHPTSKNICTEGLLGRYVRPSTCRYAGENSVVVTSSSPTSGWALSSIPDNDEVHVLAVVNNHNGGKPKGKSKNDSPLPSWSGQG